MLLEAKEPQGSQKQAPVKTGQHHRGRRYIMSKKPHRTPNPCVSCFADFPTEKLVNRMKTLQLICQCCRTEYASFQDINHRF